MISVYSYDLLSILGALYLFFVPLVFRCLSAIDMSLALARNQLKTFSGILVFSDCYDIYPCISSLFRLFPEKK